MRQNVISVWLCIILIVGFLLLNTQFKEAVAKKFNAQPEQLCLIFAGKIMKDHENLTNHNIKDGLTVHLVIKAPRSAATQNNQEASANQQRPACE